ncbi:MAG: hypothetical protein GY946_11590 [bacterium]|nr:hypothetical protein [bacterium]
MRILDLASVDPAKEIGFGGKAAGLARLIAAGARVPAGFAIEATVANPDEWNDDERQSLLSKSRRLLPDLLAVRSSALGEDGSEQSFAGLFESILEVGDEQALISAAGCCIASGASERVRAYTKSEATVPVGVVVQRLVRARAAGVVFTRDPAGRDRAVVIEAVRGLGDKLVSGHTEPERWRVHRSGLGGFEAHLEHLGEGEPALGESEAIAIAVEALRLERELGHPLDLEWALEEDSEPWWLQARPITAVTELPPEPRIERTHSSADDGPVSVWSNLNIRETMPDPLPVFSWCLWRDRFLPALVAQGSARARRSGLRDAANPGDRVQGRIYGNLNAMFAIPVVGQIIPRMADEIDANAGPAIRELTDRGVLVPRRFDLRTRWLVWSESICANLKYFPAFVGSFRPEARLRHFRRFGARMIARRDAPLRDRTIPDLLDELDTITDAKLLDPARMMWSLLFAVASYGLARHVFRDHPEAQGLLAVGIANNPTTAMSLELETLTEAAMPIAGAFGRTTTTHALFEELEESAEGRAWLAGLADFLDWNGHRCPKEFDVATPRWLDDPGMLLDIVRCGLAEPPKEGVRERLDRLAEERRVAIRAAVASAPRWKRPLLRWTARLAERHLPNREAGKHYLLTVFPRIRTIALEIGARMTERGLLEQPEDVFHLEVAELTEGALTAQDARSLVKSRREELAAFEQSPAPDFVRSDGVPVPTVQACRSGDGALTGTGISTGRIEGRVRVLHEPDPNAFEAGEVIVVRFADPGWTPLFSRAGAIVMEVGGLMCHAAVVARELGIPAVFGVPHATSELSDGTMVEVDADSGMITVI